VRRVLFLAYHFPPVGGAGVQRSAKFARYLGDEGYASLVVTGPGAVGGRWTPGDEDLVRDVPAEVEVVRVSGPVPAESEGWRGRAERWLGLKRAFDTWWVEGAVAAAQDTDADVILASMSPFESAQAAARLARRLGRPWVADLRDPWALDEMHVYPSRLHRAAALRRMRRVLATADAVVMNTPEAAARLKAFPEFAGRLVVSITNGFDPGDFGGDSPRRDDGDRKSVV